VLVNKRADRSVIERQRVREHLKKHHTERVNVGSAIYIFAEPELLRTGILRRSHQRRDRRTLGIADQLADSKVHHLHLISTGRPLHQENIGGFEIAMKDMLGVRFLQRRGDLP
jgi:hypothetical protein